MYIKFIWLVIVLLAILQDVQSKKSKKKRINNDDESTPQPNVLTYSTFGFNDVGSYEGFVPSSPDFPNYFTTSNKQESSTRLYAPAFPSAQDTTGLGSYYDPQPDVGSFSISSDGYQTGVQPLQPSLQTVFTSPSNDQNNDHDKNTESQIYNLNSDETKSPIYGTKLSSKNKDKSFDGLNHTNDNIYGSASSVINNDAILVKNLNNNYSNLQTVTQTKDNDKYFMISSPLGSTSLKFPKVVDFTRVKNYYPTSIESSFPESNNKPFDLDLHQNVASNANFNPYKSYIKTEQNDEQTLKNKLRYKEEKSKSEKVNHDAETDNFTSEDMPDIKINFKNTRNKNSYKDKVKNKPWSLNNNNNEVKKSKNPTKGYDYSTNYSSTSFRFDSNEPIKPFNSSIDEIVPSGSSLDFVNYELPEKDFSEFKDIHNLKSPYDGQSHTIISNKHTNKYKPSEEYLNSFKNLFTTVPSTTSHWGNIFKTSDFSSYKNHVRKPYYKDDINDDVVHIPKRQQDFNNGKYFEPYMTDWSFTKKYKPYKIKDETQQLDWTKDIFNTRFKSEEDLLGLRNHDTSHPSYVPTYKHNYNDFAEEFDYKKLVQKWRQNYIKSKYRDSNREYETYASETKPIHVPLPRPYPIEVPRPVIVPVPQPYPVKVPIPKPIAVPVVREITVPIEKPVPYPVIKNVPYPIEKLVPVPVQKQVHVPVVKPYPVHVPQIRPVFHHTKPHDERDVEQEEEDYHPRANSERPNYQRPKIFRNRPRVPSRRPSRTTYQDRDRRRVPNRRPFPHRDLRPRPSYSSDIRTPHRYRDDFEDYESDSEFEYYCKRTGKC